LYKKTANKALNLLAVLVTAVTKVFSTTLAHLLQS